MKRIILIISIFSFEPILSFQSACICENEYNNICKQPINLNIQNTNTQMTESQQIQFLILNYQTFVNHCPRYCYPYKHLGASMYYNYTDAQECDFEEKKYD